MNCQIYSIKYAIASHHIHTPVEQIPNVSHIIPIRACTKSKIKTSYSSHPSHMIQLAKSPAALLGWFPVVVWVRI